MPIHIQIEELPFVKYCNSLAVLDVKPQFPYNKIQIKPLYGYIVMISAGISMIRIYMGTHPIVIDKMQWFE